MTERLPRFFWLWLPLVILVSLIACEIVVPESMKPAFFSEEGPHEKFQALIMGVAFVYAARLLFAVKGGWLKAWFGVAALACLYVAGEEISWGQTYLEWATPESWGALNDQNETNLHNTSAWLDQKPKIMLQIGVLVGGIIIPLLQRFKPQKLPERFAMIYPTWQTSVAAGIALGFKLIDTVQDIVREHLFWRISENLEIYIYYFVLMYLMEMTRRFRRPAQG